MSDSGFEHTLHRYLADVNRSIVDDFRSTAKRRDRLRKGLAKNQDNMLRQLWGARKAATLAQGTDAASEVRAYLSAMSSLKTGSAGAIKASVTRLDKADDSMLLGSSQTKSGRLKRASTSSEASGPPGFQRQMSLSDKLNKPRRRPSQQGSCLDSDTGSQSSMLPSTSEQFEPAVDHAKAEANFGHNPRQNNMQDQAFRHNIFATIQGDPLEQGDGLPHPLMVAHLGPGDARAVGMYTSGAASRSAVLPEPPAREPAATSPRLFGPDYDKSSTHARAQAREPQRAHAGDTHATYARALEPSELGRVVRPQELAQVAEARFGRPAAEYRRATRVVDPAHVQAEAEPDPLEAARAVLRMQFPHRRRYREGGHARTASELSAAGSQGQDQNQDDMAGHTRSLSGAGLRPSPAGVAAADPGMIMTVGGHRRGKSITFAGAPAPTAHARQGSSHSRSGSLEGLAHAQPQKQPHPQAQAQAQAQVQVQAGALTHERRQSWRDSAAGFAAIAEDGAAAGPAAPPMTTGTGTEAQAGAKAGQKPRAVSTKPRQCQPVPKSAPRSANGAHKRPASATQQSSTGQPKALKQHGPSKPGPRQTQQARAESQRQAQSRRGSTVVQSQPEAQLPTSDASAQSWERLFGSMVSVGGLVGLGQPHGVTAQPHAFASPRATHAFAVPQSQAQAQAQGKPGVDRTSPRVQPPSPGSAMLLPREPDAHAASDRQAHASIAWALPRPLSRQGSDASLSVSEASSGSADSRGSLVQQHHHHQYHHQHQQLAPRGSTFQARKDAVLTRWADTSKTFAPPPISRPQTARATITRSRAVAAGDARTRRPASAAQSRADTAQSERQSQPLPQPHTGKITRPASAAFRSQTQAHSRGHSTGQDLYPGRLPGNNTWLDGRNSARSAADHSSDVLPEPGLDLATVARQLAELEREDTGLHFEFDLDHGDDGYDDDDYAAAGY